MTIYPDRQDDVQMTWGAIKPKVGEMWTDGNHAFVLMEHSPSVHIPEGNRFLCYFPQLEEYHLVRISGGMTRLDSWVS